MFHPSVITSRNCLWRVIVWAAACSTATWAAPYLPKSDSEVLERVPARSDLDRLSPLRRRVADNPQDLPAALDLAKGYLQIGRANADPRFTGYAEATLLPWMNTRPIPEPVLVLQATALQNQHQFGPAMALLDTALLNSPLDPQIWLTRAAIYALRNDAPAARRACARLTRTADSLVALTCLTGINSRNGQLSASYAALRQVYHDDVRLPVELRVWILTQLADMAERAGDDPAAEHYFRQALMAAPEDGFTLAAYADLLNRVGRNAEVPYLLRGREAQDNLLLRLSIAGHRLGSSEGAHWSELYAARVAAAQREGDTVHLREQALFELEVRGNRVEGLRLAQQNWQTQREPADVRIFVHAALTGHGGADAASESARHALREWLASTHYEDATLHGMLL